MKQHSAVKKLAIAGLLTAVAVVGSLFSIPVLGSQCSPVQHMVNILCAVFLGPWYGLGSAFAASFLRNLLGLGTLLAFPGSMVGALVCGLTYWGTRNLGAACAGEVFGTGILGGLAAWPIATLLLGKPVPIIITDKSGRAGVAYWINHNLKLTGTPKEVTKKHPAVGKIYDDIMRAYENGRTTHFSYEEMQRLVLRHMPEFTITEYDRMKQLAGELSAHVICMLSQDKALLNFDEAATALLENFSVQHPFIQLISLTDDRGILKCMALTADKEYRKLYEGLAPGYDFSDREWYREPMKTGDLYIMDVYPSRFTGKLIITVSCAVTNDEDHIVGVLSCDMQVEQILKHAQDLVPDEE